MNPYIYQETDGTFTIKGLKADQSGSKPSPMVVRTNTSKRRQIENNGSAFAQLGDPVTVEGHQAHVFRGFNVSTAFAIPSPFGATQTIFLNPRSTDDGTPADNSPQDETSNDEAPKDIPS